MVGDKEQCGVSSRSGTRNTFSSISSLSPLKSRQGAVRCLKPKRDSQHILFHLLSLSLEIKTRSSAVQGAVRCLKPKRDSQHILLHLLSLSLEIKTRSSAVSQAEAGLATHSLPSPLSPLKSRQGAVRCLKPKRDSQHILLHLLSLSLEIKTRSNKEQCGVSSRSGTRNTFSSISSLSLEIKTRSSAVSQAEAGLATHSPPSLSLSLKSRQGAVRCLKPKRDSQHILFHLLSLSLEIKTRSSAVQGAVRCLKPKRDSQHILLHLLSLSLEIKTRSNKEQCGVSSRSGTRNTFSSISSLSPLKSRQGAVRCLKPKRDSQHILFHLLSLSLEIKTRSSAVSQAEAGLATHSPPSPLSPLKSRQGAVRCLKPKRDSQHILFHLLSLSLEIKTRSSAVSQAEAGLATHSPPSPLSLP
ncbi:hypothetical protein BLNAU_23494 [Blattamonas nauphoetae]|uniref:Uncharacterized protein n=1 Tax=Blattamonas nauphoetae TaxID=2049346 RepID=A0ABQ9WQ31_9EUKA|nr:hypothetical protein BLNAU_23494 [Blattamonas nauphoetae]